MTKASMGSFLIVETQPRCECCAPLRGVGVRYGVGPFAQEGLDRALGFAVGLGAIGSGAFGLDAEPAAGFAKRRGTISTAVVGQHTLDVNAVTVEFAQCTQPEMRGGIALLIGQDLNIGKARTVVNCDVHIFPADTPSGVAAIAGNAMARPCDASQFLDVQVDQLAGPAPLVSLHRLRRVQE